jgi:hypothetical protein
LEEGKSAEALTELRGLLPGLRALKADQSIHGLMPGAERAARMCDVVWDGLVTGKWGDAELLALDGLLLQVHCAHGWGEKAVGMIRNRAMFYETLYAMPTSTRVREVRRCFMLSNAPWWLTEFNLSASSRSMLRRNQSLDVLCQLRAFSCLDDNGDFRPPVPMENPLGHDLSWIERLKYSLALDGVLGLDQSALRVAIIEAKIRQARIAVALERFRRARGDWPDTLAALVPDFIPELPRDPFSQAPMHYRREPETGWRLWSVGKDLKDNDGFTTPWLEASPSSDIVWPQWKWPKK